MLVFEWIISKDNPTCVLETVTGSKSWVSEVKQNHLALLRAGLATLSVCSKTLCSIVFIAKSPHDI
jgi:hypothetical protein